MVDAPYLSGARPEEYVAGCAALVDESGIFVPTPDKGTKLSDIRDGTSNTILFVELADPEDMRACITLEEFYEQLQNCPSDVKVYRCSMADGGFYMLLKTITLEELRKLVSKSGMEEWNGYPAIKSLN